MTDEKEIALEVENVSKSFRLPIEQASGIKQAFINRVKGIKGYREQHVLKDISFKIERGDFFGIVGRNGSGKSTLLKLISGIYTQDSGKIAVNGTLVPFIELGVGFNPELTGRENVYLNGAMLGFSNAEIDKMYDDLVNFAELHDFMDQKLKNYSSGMQVRLAFSVAIKAQGDILVLDEVLAVGDEAFQRKCDEFFQTIKKDKSKTVILVTHSMDSVRKYCTKATMIRKGKIVVSSTPEDVANEYSLENVSVTTIADNGTKRDSVVRDIDVKLLSPKKISESQLVEIRVQYRVMENIATKIMLNLVDINRQIPLYAGSTDLIKGHMGDIIERTFKISLGEINDTSVQVALSIRNDSNGVLAFPPESLLPAFILRREDYPDESKKSSYAVMYNRGEWSKK